MVEQVDMNKWGCGWVRYYDNSDTICKNIHMDEFAPFFLDFRILLNRLKT